MEKVREVSRPATLWAWWDARRRERPLGDYQGSSGRVKEDSGAFPQWAAGLTAELDSLLHPKRLRKPEI